MRYVLLSVVEIKKRSEDRLCGRGTEETDDIAESI